MAKTTKTKDILTRDYVIPLRRGCLKSPRYKRGKKAISVIQQFIVRHMKAEVVKIGPHLNTKVWKNGIKNVPARVEITASREVRKLREKDKEEKAIVTVELKEIPKLGKRQIEKEAKVKKEAAKKDAKPKAKISPKEDAKDSKKDKTSEAVASDDNKESKKVSDKTNLAKKSDGVKTKSNDRVDAKDKTVSEKPKPVGSNKVIDSKKSD